MKEPYLETIYGCLSYERVVFMSIILIVGASGSGKSTIGAELKKRGIPELVSFTTREKRKGEIDGEDYYFVDKSQLKDLNIVESSVYSGNTYGLLEHEVEGKLDTSDNVFCIVDRNGARQIADMFPNDVIVFWLVINVATMRERMIVRKDNPEAIKLRLKNAIDTNELRRPNLDGVIDINANYSKTETASHFFYELGRRL